MRFAYFIIGLMLMIAACKKEEVPTSLSQVEWLVGDWQGTYQGGPFYESWRKVNDSVMVNFGLMITPADTMVKESSFIRLRKDGIIHGNQEYVWATEKLTDTEMVFINDKVDYANRIIWSHSQQDHWLVEIQNPKGKVNYDLTRISWTAPLVDEFIRSTGR